jgi:ribonuclease HI
MPPRQERPSVEIYTDGGCDPNPGPGGWGAVLKSGPHLTELSGYERRTTNNRMELTAAIEALAHLKQACEVDLYTDSQYLRRGITEWIPGWVRRNWVRANGSPVENVDLWKALLAQAERHTARWHWVRGHRGHRWNERADTLATEARRARTARRRQASEQAQAASEPRRPAPPALELPRYEVYCRGCALGDAGGPAGYAALIVAADGKTTERAGGWPLATGNQMELWAVIAGLQALPVRSSVTIHTPSTYVLEGATRWLAGWERNGWRTSAGQPVKNRELWQELAEVMGDHDIHWEHLTSGAAHARSDETAAMARTQAEKQRELP